jgi:predicted nucleic acid-binding protein
MAVKAEERRRATYRERLERVRGRLARTRRTDARGWQDLLLDGKARLLALHLDAPLEPAEPDRREVLTVALDYGATVYDAVFITLALAHDVPFITAERTTTRWVTKLGKRIEAVR